MDGLKDRPRAGRPRRFPPQQVAEVKAIACELPVTHGLTLGRFSRAELHRLVIERGVTDASATTIWGWLRDDALKPWQTQRSSTRPAFAGKRGSRAKIHDRVRPRLRRPTVASRRVRHLRRREVPAAGARGAATPPCCPGRGAPALVEFEYRRGGTLAYPAAWDVHHANLDRVEPKTGIAPFGRLVEQVMSTEPYASARRAFWIVDNGSSHAGNTSIERLQHAWPNARLIHLPIQASWLNQIDLYFSILERKAPTPNDLASLDDLARRLLTFGAHYRHVARPFECTFTRPRPRSRPRHDRRPRATPHARGLRSERTDASTRQPPPKPPVTQGVGQRGG